MTDTISFTPDIPADKEAEIQSRLTAIEREHDVRFLFAIESGSRAWGFPSPDSDFDVRFVYARPQDWYLSIHPGRDVIETPLEGDWDINGWDVKKALGLLLKPNPVLLEWLSSPIHYRWDDRPTSLIRKLAEDCIRPVDCIPHYYHLGHELWRRNIANSEEVKLKKYFYTIRPALAIRWVRMHPDLLPPMNFQDLVNATDVTADAKAIITDLLAKKAEASEVGTGKRIAVLDDLIQQEYTWAEDNKPRRETPDPATVERANSVFRAIVRDETT